MINLCYKTYTALTCTASIHHLNFYFSLTPGMNDCGVDHIITVIHSFGLSVSMLSYVAVWVMLGQGDTSTKLI